MAYIKFSERETMLEIKNLSYSVTDEKTGKQVKILDDVSVTINERFVAVTGPNGSGKSTLAKLIAGIYKADSGQIIHIGDIYTVKNYLS